MRRIFFVSIVVMSLLGAAGAQAGEMEETLIGLEQQLCEAFANQDLATVDKLMTKDAMSAEGGRLFTRDAGIEFHVEGVEFESYALSDFKVIPFSKDVAAVYMRADTHATRNGKKLASINYVTTIWVNQDGQWKAAYSTSYSPTSVEETLIALEHQLCAAFQNKDIATIKRLVADNAVVAEEGRVFTQRADSIAFHVDDVVIKDFKLSDFTVTRLSEDMAVVNMRADTDATRGGEKLSEVNFVSTVWQQQHDGQWQAVHSTSYSPEGY